MKIVNMSELLHSSNIDQFMTKPGKLPVGMFFGGGGKGGKNKKKNKKATKTSAKAKAPGKKALLAKLRKKK